MAKRKTKKDTALAELIAAETPKGLSGLILHLAENYPEIRRGIRPTWDIDMLGITNNKDSEDNLLN
jgi:hypothetical protein